MCDHKKRPKLFCIFDKCAEKQCFGCLICIKNTHKKCRIEQFIDENNLVQILSKFQFRSEASESQKACNIKVYKLLTRVKSQINNKIDQVISQIMSKIKYPFLFRSQLLDIYRNIRDRNYLRLQSTKLRKFYQIGKNLDQEDFAEKEILYYRQYLPETEKQLSEIFNKLYNLEKTFKFNIHEDIKSLQINCQKQIQQFLKSNNNNNKESKNGSNQKLSFYSDSNQDVKKQKVQFLTPFKQKSLLNVSIDYLHINSSSREKQRRKSDDFSIENQSKQTLWKSPLSSREQIEKKSRILEDQIFSQSSNFKFSNLHGFKNWFDERSQVSQKKNKKVQTQINKNLKIDKNTQKLFQYSQSSTNNLQIKIIEQRRETKCTENNNGLQESIQFIHKLTESSKKLNELETKKRNHQNQMESIRTQRQQHIRKRIQDMMKEKQISKKKYQEKNQKIAKSPKKSYESPKKNQIKDSQKGQTNSQLRKSPKKSDNVSLNKQVFKGNEKAKDLTSNISNIVNMKDIPLVDQLIQQKTKKLKLTKKKSLNTVQDEIQGACLYYLKIKEIKQKQKLIQFLQSYIERCPNNLTAVQHLTYLYIQQGKAKQCLNIINEYLQKMDSLPFNQSLKLNLIINKSAALNMLGRYTENISYVSSKLQKIEHQKLHKNLGDAYFSMNTFDKAVYHYQKAIKLNEKYDEAYYNLAAILYNQQSYFNAMMNISKALSIESRNQFYEELFGAINQRIKMSQRN